VDMVSFVEEPAMDSVTASIVVHGIAISIIDILRNFVGRLHAKLHHAGWIR
jgi:ABC-type antimicrobial peptide transport system permease subunit